ALGLAFRWWHEHRRRDATLALVFLGLATLAKGPVAVALFAFTVGAFLAWQADLGRLRGLPTAPGIVAFVVLGLGCYAVALAAWPDGADIRRAAVAALAAVVVVAGAVAIVRGRWSPMSASDRRTAMALGASFPGGVAGLAIAAGGALGVVAIAVAWRAWALL